MSNATAGKGSIFSRGDGATPTEAFTAIAEVTSITGPNMTAETIDVTNMDSGGWREFITSLKDAGEVSFGLNFQPGATSHIALIQDEIDTQVRNYRIEWPDAKVAATLATGSAGSNTGITWTAVRAGAVGNDITVRMVNPGTTASLSVSVSGKAITVNLAYSGGITSTAAQVRTAVLASAAAAALVTPTLTGGNSGAGVVSAVGATNLSGGRGSRWVLPGIINNFSVSAAIDRALEASVTLKVSGQPTIEGVS